MIDQSFVERTVMALPDVARTYPYDKTTAVFQVNDRMFALLNEGTTPVRLSLRCEPQLATLLREKYETVMPAHKLDKRFWNTLILSGQLGEDEVKDLIRHAYEVVKLPLKPLG